MHEIRVCQIARPVDGGEPFRLDQQVGSIGAPGVQHAKIEMTEQAQRLQHLRPSGRGGCRAHRPVAVTAGSLAGACGPRRR